MLDEITIKGARQNNLKNIDIVLPRNKLIVFTGVSGSGKSSLAFDTIYAEGQRRYMESLSTYARQFLEKVDKPDVDLIDGISPAIAIEQKNPVKHARSTVGTATEIYDFLRLLFAKIGIPHCPKCGRPVEVSTAQSISDFIAKNYPGERILISFPLAPDPGESAQDIARSLLKKGFLRIQVKTKIIHLENGTLPDVDGTEEFKVIVDRLTVTPDNSDFISRASESIETAFREGGQNVHVQIVGEKVLKFNQNYQCANCNLPVEKPGPSFFSFNSPHGACPECNGFGNKLTLDMNLIVPNKDKPLSAGAVDPWTKPSYKKYNRMLTQIAEDAGIDMNKPYRSLSDREKKILVDGYGPFKGVKGFFQELEEKKYKLHKRVFLRRYQSQRICPLCKGTKLRLEALQIKVHGLMIADIHRMSIKRARRYFATLKLSDYEESVAREILKQIVSRLDFLSYVGLDYLSIDRLTRTLSGGEAQRITLANQLGAQLAGTLYILDEPTIGLHPRDNRRLLAILKKLTAAGNTVMVVEHDRDVISSADHLVELGPAAGEEGGHIVYQGSLHGMKKSSKSLTGRYLTGEAMIPLPEQRRGPANHFLALYGARENNLKGIDLEIPLRRFTCITGVSGSGKSTLIHDTLFNALSRLFHSRLDPIGRFDTISGLDKIKNVAMLDQHPIGRTPRSNPITYIKGFSDIRDLFAGTPLAERRDLHPGYFSFNVPGGRCETCQGEGFIKLEMHFLADIYLTCGDCNGIRYRSSTLEIRIRGKHIGHILSMSVDEAIDFFHDQPRLLQKLRLLSEVGLGYLRLGQPANTLSGGEAQRLKIAAELGRKNARDILYLLDEPTTGLHLDDIRKLLAVLDRLVEAGNTVVVIEHNLDVIKFADHIIDLGPEGGDKGGEIVAQGTPEEIIMEKRSFTGKYLREHLINQRSAKS